MHIKVPDFQAFVAGWCGRKHNACTIRIQSSTQNSIGIGKSTVVMLSNDLVDMSQGKKIN